MNRRDCGNAPRERLRWVDVSGCHSGEEGDGASEEDDRFHDCSYAVRVWSKFYQSCCERNELLAEEVLSFNM